LLMWAPLWISWTLLWIDWACPSSLWASSEWEAFSRSPKNSWLY
jgi:hypothetical protein